MFSLRLQKATETSLSLTWAASPAASLALESRHVPAPWGASPPTPLPATATSFTLQNLLPTATYELRLIATLPSGAAFTGEAAAFDTLPAGCGGGGEGKPSRGCTVA
jgi:hypothetical protein